MPFGKILEGEIIGPELPTWAAFKNSYTGQEYDKSTGLYFYQSRFYDADIGRFISADTIVPEPTDGQSYNRYTYVNNNPFKFTDPTGHFISILALLIIGYYAFWGAVIGAAVGALIGYFFPGLFGAETPIGGAIRGAFFGMLIGAAIGAIIGWAVAYVPGVASEMSSLVEEIKAAGQSIRAQIDISFDKAFGQQWTRIKEFMRGFNVEKISGESKGIKNLWGLLDSKIQITHASIKNWSAELGFKGLNIIGPNSFRFYWSPFDGKVGVNYGVFDLSWRSEKGFSIGIPIPFGNQNSLFNQFDVSLDEKGISYSIGKQGGFKFSYSYNLKSGSSLSVNADIVLGINIKGKFGEGGVTEGSLGLKEIARYKYGTDIEPGLYLKENYVDIFNDVFKTSLQYNYDF